MSSMSARLVACLTTAVCPCRTAISVIPCWRSELTSRKHIQLIRSPYPPSCLQWSRLGNRLSLTMPLSLRKRRDVMKLKVQLEIPIFSSTSLTLSRLLSFSYVAQKTVLLYYFLLHFSYDILNIVSSYFFSLTSLCCPEDCLIVFLSPPLLLRYSEDCLVVFTPP